jgi:hypothetical protein
MTTDPALFTTARWIWDGSDPFGYHYYLRARRAFTLAPGQAAKLAGGSAPLRITAEAFYQLWINGRIVGHGPAKSAEFRRSVDTYEVAPFLQAGENLIELLVMSHGVGSSTLSAAPAGVIFELDLGGAVIASDAKTLVRPDPQRRKTTVRRWFLPCVEDVDAAKDDGRWRPATVVERTPLLYPRRVPLPTRQVVAPRRLVAAEQVRLNNFSVSFRHRPYLMSADEARRCNNFDTPAYFLTEIVSPAAQEIEFVPTLGAASWYFEGRPIFHGSAWTIPDPRLPNPVIRLKKGGNLVIGIHHLDHIEDLSLAGNSRLPVRFRNPFGAGGFQALPMTKGEMVEGEALNKIYWESLRPRMPKMDPVHTMVGGNAADLVVKAETLPGSVEKLAPLLRNPAGAPLRLPGGPAGCATRLILDLGVIHNGWLTFTANGRQGSSLVFLMFEYLEEGPPRLIQWPKDCNNVLTYRLRDGRQEFESFLPHGVRYLAIHVRGPAAVELSDLRVLTANCGSQAQGSLLCDDPILNGVWGIGLQSVIAGVDDTCTDCPTYEQANWNCDNRLTLSGERFLTANTAVARNTIQVFAEDADYPGLVRCEYPSAWLRHLPVWSYQWIMMCEDFFRQTGDRAFLDRVLAQVGNGVEEALLKLNAQGLHEWPGAWHLVEWGPGRDDDHAVMGGEQATFVGAMGAAERLARVAGKTDLAKRWQTARRKLVSAINRVMWDPKRGAYRDSVHEDGLLSEVSSQATNAAMIIYGVADSERAAKLARRIAKNELLPCGSPFGLYYVTELLDQFGYTDRLFDLIRKHWGEMILAGDGTVWETFDWWDHGFPSRSRCHPYSVFVIKYLVKYLLGVESLAPGFAVCRVAPRPPKGVTRCQGVVPTPRGRIRVTWTKKKGKMECAVELPKGIRRA